MGQALGEVWPDGRWKLPDQFDVRLEDDDLLGEVELTTTLIIAASESDGHLSQEEVDRLLGVTPVPPPATPAE